MTQEVKLRRVQCNHQAENARFLLECDFSKQYSHYYRKRLEKTRPFIELSCRSKWGPSIPLYSLIELAQVTSSQLNLSSGLISEASDEDSPSPSPNSNSASFETAKRLRRFSGPSKEDSRPLTSTQKTPSTPTIEGQPSGPSPIFESPILQPGTSKQELTTPQLVTNRQSHSNLNRCIVIGTVFKRMKLQPDVIEELSHGDLNVKTDRYLGHYTSQEDRLVLEDSNESISLTGNIDPGKFVTGIIVAVLGRSIDDGSQFMVFDVCYAQPNRMILYDDIDDGHNKDLISNTVKTPETVIRSIQQPSEPIYLMLVSGLGFRPGMEKESSLTRALQNMIDFIWGGSEYSEDKRSSRVARILVLGESLHGSRLELDEDGSSQKIDVQARVKQSRQVKQHVGSLQSIKHMDDFFALLSKTINVDVMPGSTDPSTHLFPQQPFHPCMFPKSCMFPTFSCTTNPYHAIYNDSVEVLATSGQNVDIISKFSMITDPIEIMKCHLKWGNCAPSAPDNLYSVPDENDDPYVIDFIPEVYVSGCQNSYRAEFFQYDSNTSSQTSALNETVFSSTQAQSNASLQHCRDTKTKSQSVLCNQAGDHPKKKSQTLLVTVPRFHETQSCVLIDLGSLESQLLSFKD